ncbi:MAG: hypothetical protein OQJ98_01830 [Candidatus Pacebacteria bacterium]|nr:hypothetical protein [Candidatus Paceibacterota bacterium]
MNNRMIIGVLVVIALLFGWYYYNEGTAAGQYDEFAQCITDSGTKFYGTFWCPHCQNQKKVFGSSEKFLPYIECSTPNGQAQLQICKDAGVMGYPTWEFPDGSRLTGEVEFSTLAEETGCTLPQQ